MTVHRLNVQQVFAPPAPSTDVPARLRGRSQERAAAAEKRLHGYQTRACDGSDEREHALRGAVALAKTRPSE